MFPSFKESLMASPQGSEETQLTRYRDRDGYDVMTKFPLDITVQYRHDTQKQGRLRGRPSVGGNILMDNLLFDTSPDLL